jgi:hypothetical protein
LVETTEGLVNCEEAWPSNQQKAGAAIEADGGSPGGGQRPYHVAIPHLCVRIGNLMSARLFALTSDQAPVSQARELSKPFIVTAMAVLIVGAI